MAKVKYVEVKTFEDMDKNHKALIGILNHNMTDMKEALLKVVVDVSWIKRIVIWSFGLFATIVGGVIVSRLMV